MADEAVPLLRAALVKEPESSDAYEQLAMAYGHNKNFAEADLASAEAAFARGADALSWLTWPSGYDAILVTADGRRRQTPGLPLLAPSPPGGSVARERPRR